MDRFDVLIVGGGHGGAQTAIQLRQHKFAGSIAIVSDETELPYERPPLSKEFLSGEKSREDLQFRKPEYWAAHDIQFLGGEKIVSIDAAARTVESSSGGTFGYSVLVWAAGGRARRLPFPGSELHGVHSIRTLADVSALRGDLANAQKIVAIGAGCIGLEAAAVLRRLGKAVCVVEAASRVLPRVAGVEISEFIASEHRSQGVEIRLNAQVVRLHENLGRVRGVELADGEMIEADLVIVGIGIVPNVEPVLAAGADGTNGIRVDTYCRTALFNVYAVGDCTRHLNPFGRGRSFRLESVQNANDQARVVARNIVGEYGEYDALPWFWSNQYDLHLQSAGVASSGNRSLLRGDPNTRSFSVLYLSGDQLVAISCINATRDYVGGRALILAQASPDPKRLVDPTQSLQDLA